jgi:hypothetical protein
MHVASDEKGRDEIGEALTTMAAVCVFVCVCVCVVGGGGHGGARVEIIMVLKEQCAKRTYDRLTAHNVCCARRLLSRERVL